MSKRNNRYKEQNAILEPDAIKEAFDVTMEESLVVDEITPVVEEPMVVDEVTPVVEEPTVVVKEESEKSKIVRRHLDAIGATVEAIPFNTINIASKHYGFLNAVRVAMVGTNPLELKELDVLFEEYQYCMDTDKVHIGTIEWKWGTESKEAYSTLIAILQLRRGGGFIYGKNVQQGFKGQYEELGQRLTALL